MTKEEKRRDGIFFRVKRNNKYEAICFSDLEASEMREVMKTKDVEWLRSLIVLLLEHPLSVFDDRVIETIKEDNIEFLKNYAISLGNDIYNND